jgi:hypothetical protein
MEVTKYPTIMNASREVQTVTIPTSCVAGIRCDYELIFDIVKGGLNNIM